jgi:Tol biopolymer transport system component
MRSQCEREEDNLRRLVSIASVVSGLLAGCGGQSAAVHDSTPASASPTIGGMIAFVHDGDGDETNADDDQSIFVINADGTGQHELIRGITVDSPTWSPDGKTIAFAKQSGSKSAIFVIRADGTKLTRLTADGGDFAPVWSPLGDRIAYLKDKGDWMEIYVMNRDGTQPEWVGATTGKATRLSWSPDAKNLAVDEEKNGETTILVLGAQTSGVGVGVTVGRGETPAWSADGKQLAVIVDFKVIVGRADGTGQHSVPGGGRQYRWPSWAPDGRWLAVDGNASGSAQIYVIPVNGTGERQLTTLKGSNFAPAWTAAQP